MMWLALAVAGALGAVARAAVDVLLARLFATSRPIATVTINVVGAGIAGFVLAFGATSGGTVIAVGFLGAFTTFSTTILHVVEFVRANRLLAALGHAIGPVIAATVAAWVGFLLGSVTQ